MWSMQWSIHATKSCYHDPANASVRPDGWIVKEEFSKKELEFSTVAVFKPDFSIFFAIGKAIDSSTSAIDVYDTIVCTYDPIKRNNNDTNNVERRVDLSYDNDNNNNNIVSPDWKQHASMKQTIPCSVQNEGNSSVVSYEKQYGSYKTENDIDFDDDYID